KDFCKRCPDCIYYGYAIGDQGSERSKVLVDSAFSITGYDLSHQHFTFNALAENGTMYENGKMRVAFGEQDYVLPQVYFPSVVTIKDPTEAEFLYVLNNILHTRRYGAQNTRTGTVDNHLVGVVFSNGEICSNLQLTQAVYDRLSPEQRAQVPLERNAVLAAMTEVVPTLLQEDGVVFQLLHGERLQTLLREMTQLTSNEQQLIALLSQASADAGRYADQYGVGASKKESKAKQ
ncbi:MAG: type I-D CRISPR-associated protein Cas7/Csc2, partial [Ktedonobacteraceae bacterium]|nr:type I-D CRISPR-associated protein Cas7/Csc2 [Ktedonobacteraceae bacterium]